MLLLKEEEAFLISTEINLISSDGTWLSNSPLFVLYYELGVSLDMVSVIPVLLGFFISSLAHPGKWDTSVSNNKSCLSWKGELQCKHSSELKPLHLLSHGQGFGNAEGYLLL